MNLFEIVWQILLLIAIVCASQSRSTNVTQTGECLHRYVPPGCELECYQAGTRGPCGKGQVFVPVAAALNLTLLRGEAFGDVFCSRGHFKREVEFDQKFASLANRTSYGYCVWNETDYPCFDLPANQRFSNETQNCRTVGFQEYCPQNEAFYAYGPWWHKYNQMYGACDCFPPKEMWYYPEDGNCYPLNTQGPCKGNEWLTVSNGSTFGCQPAPASNRTCLLPYPAWRCVHAKCYVVGTQGPCSNGQIFLTVPDSINKAELRGGALGKACAYNYGEGLIHDRDVGLQPNLNTTIPPFTNPIQKYGYCVWKDISHPCDGRPANQRYSDKTQACHTLGLKEHCGKNLVFQEVPDNSLGGKYGECDCWDLQGMWYDPQNNLCFAPHLQGWCPDGQWLTMKSKDGPVICEETACPGDGRHVYWSKQCYLRGETGPCSKDELLFPTPGILTCVKYSASRGVTIYGPVRNSVQQRCDETFSRLPHISDSASCTKLRNYSHYLLDGKSHPCRDGDYARSSSSCVRGLSNTKKGENNERWYPEDELPLWLFKLRFGQLRCWFSGLTEITAYFYTPLGILIGINTMSFIWAAVAYYRSTVSSQVGAVPGGQKQIRKRLFTSLRVFVLMGVSWAAEVISFAIGSTTWSMATDVWNLMQGILIFWMFVCKKDVLRIIEKKLQSLKKSVQDRFNLPFFG